MTMTRSEFMLIDVPHSLTINPNPSRFPHHPPTSLPGRKKKKC